MTNITQSGAAGPPPRFQQYASGGRKIALAIGGVFLLIVAGVAARYFLARPAPTPTPTQHASHDSRGLDFPARPQKVAMSLPRPDRTPTQQAKQAVTNNSQPPHDPVLDSDGFMKNDDSSGSQLASYGSQSHGGAGGETSDDGQVKPAGLGPAAKAQIDWNYLYEVPAGRKIPCVMDVAINTELHGPVTCVIPEEVRNYNNTAVLIPRGSHVYGVAEHGLSQGQHRLGIVWSRVDTSDTPPIKVALNSPAADEVGRPGMALAVNDHFWETLLATAAYSFVQFGPQIVASALSRNNEGSSTNSFQFNQFYQPEQTLASRVLEERMSRPPTGEANQGRNIMIFLNRDLDFSDAVQLRMKRRGR